MKCLHHSTKELLTLQQYISCKQALSRSIWRQSCSPSQTHTDPHAISRTRKLFSKHESEPWFRCDKYFSMLLLHSHDIAL